MQKINTKFSLNYWVGFGWAHCVRGAARALGWGSVDAICAWIGIDLAKYSIGCPFPTIPMPSKSAIADTS